MNWSGFRSFSITLGAIFGVLLGAMLWSFGSGGRWSAGIPSLLLVLVLLNLGVTLRWTGHIAETAAQRAQVIASGQAAGEPAPARVHRVIRQRTMQVSTILLLGGGEPGQLALLHVFPAAAPPRTVYVGLPARYGIQAGAPAAVVLDPTHPDIAVLDDRVTADTLAGIAADPRWLTTPVPGFFARQGGPATLLAAGAGLAVVLLLGAVLR